jgi:adenylate cyclase
VKTRAETLLCAAVSGDSNALKAAGKRGAEAAFEDYIDILRESVEVSGGRVLKTMAERIVALFATPDAAAGAAAKMCALVEAQPPLAGTKLGVRIGFHSGAVTASRDDKTLRLVLRLVAQARSGQILTTRHTAELLGTSFRKSSRDLQASVIAPSGRERAIYEVTSRQTAEREGR